MSDTYHPPKDEPAERRALSALMRGGQSSRHDATERLAPEMFTGQRQKIAEEVFARIEAGDRPDLETVKGRLESSLHRECDKCREIRCTPANYGTFFDGVKAAHLRRRMMRLGEEAVMDALDMEAGSLDAAEAAQEDFERSVLTLSGETLAGDGPKASAELTGKALDMLRQQDEETLTGVTTGFRELDKITRGWQPGWLNIIAARPSMGKSAWMGQSAMRAALGEAGVKKGGSYQVDPSPTAIISLEMPGWEMTQRMICARARVDGRKQNKTGAEWERIKAAKEEIDAAPIFVDDQSGMTPREIVARLRRLKREEDIQVAWVDYLQIIGSPRGMDFGSKTNRLGYTARALRDAGKELGVSINALAQLNRSVETGQGDSRPVISDLRGSGEIEEAANLIALMYRDMYYGVTVDADGEPTQTQVNGQQADIAEFIIGKQRGGEVGTRKLAFVDRHTAFHDLDSRSTPLPDQQRGPLPSGDGASRPSAPTPSGEYPF